MNTKYELIVVGGGLTGVAAAVCASRKGVKTLLVEASGCLGGAISQNLIYPFMRYYTNIEKDGKKYTDMLSKGFFLEFCNRLKESGHMKGHGEFQTEYVKVLLDDYIVENNVDVLFHGTLAKVNTEKGKVKSIDVATKDGLINLEADYFIDATGDGDLMAFAGCEFKIGREKDNLCQPMTLCFRVTGVDDDKFHDDFPKITPLYNEFQKQGKIKNIRDDVLLFRGLGKGIVHFNSTRVVMLNPVNPLDVSKAEIMARKQMIELYEFLKNNFESFKDSTLAFSAVSIGVRESRKLVGEHVVTADELVACTKFEDSIAVADYDIDIHSPDGGGTSHYFFPFGTYYTIPYRSLQPKEFDNLLVGGRCISSTHEAQASIRIMPTCACLGEAAGVAVAIANKSKCSVKEIDIKLLQDTLVSDGARIY